MTDMLQRQLRHDVWATDKLIAHVSKLPKEKLELTTTGTYGNIRRTLAHIVGADERYLARLLGAWDEAALREDEDVKLDDVRAHLAHVKDGIERLFAGGTFDADRTSTDTPLRRAPDAPRFEMELWVPAAQFIYHGVDHRSQIDTILSVHGLETIDLQIWPYAIELGASRQGK